MQEKQDMQGSYCRPATSCCCGCAVVTGVQCVLWFNFARCIFCIFTAFVVLVFRITEYGFLGGDRGTHALLAGAALAGIPIIVSAMWAVRKKVEAPVWIFWYFMVITFVIDEALTLSTMWYSAGPCGSGSQAFGHGGRALACGLVRSTNFGIVITLTGFEAYFLTIVYSHCLDLARTGGGPDFSDLKDFHPKEHERLIGEARHVQSYLEGCEALHEDNQFSGYGACQHPHLSGLGGSQQIFGKHHELAYPPIYEATGSQFHH